MCKILRTVAENSVSVSCARAACRRKSAGSSHRSGVLIFERLSKAERAEFARRINLALEAVKF